MKARKSVLILALVMLAVLAFPVAALARGAAQELPDISPIEEYVGAVGVGSLITLLVEILKRAGAIPDGQAGTWAACGNVLSFAALYIVGVFGFDPTGEKFQAILAILDAVGKLVLMLGSTFGLFTWLRAANVPPFRKMAGRK